MFDNLTENNLALFAIKYYDNPNCIDILEFQQDFDRIKYIKKLFKRYQSKGDLKERLILNHLVILYNVFPPQALTRILALKLGDHLHVLKPFLLYLGYWPITIDGVDGINIDCNGVPTDDNVFDILRQL
jgi:hypothetical protein